MKNYPKILFLSDPHLPYTRMDYWRKAWEFNKGFKADLVYSTGDFADQYALSRFPKHPEGHSDHTEILKCIPQVKQLKQWFPEMTIMKGNHDDRIAKRAHDNGISDHWIRDWLDLVGAPKGWSWAEKDYITTGPAILTHGFLGNRASHSAWFNKSVVHGHLHAKMGIEYFQRDREAIWVMCVGALADKKARALQYGPLRKFSTMTCGFGYTDTDGRPHLYYCGG